MKHLGIVPCLLAAIVFTLLGRSANTAKASVLQQSSQVTLASVVDREISGVEKQVIDAAAAMPEEKFNFTPESLTIPGDDYKGVRSFAVQVKHVASSNYFLWSPIAGDAVPASIKDGNGPAEMKSKAEILSRSRSATRPLPR